MGLRITNDVSSIIAALRLAEPSQNIRESTNQRQTTLTNPSPPGPASNADANLGAAGVGIQVDMPEVIVFALDDGENSPEQIVEEQSSIDQGGNAIRIGGKTAKASDSILGFSSSPVEEEAKGAEPRDTSAGGRDRTRSLGTILDVVA